MSTNTARKIVDKKPSGDALRQMMKSAFSIPDVTVVPDDETALDQQISEAAKSPGAPATAEAPHIEAISMPASVPETPIVQPTEIQQAGQGTQDIQAAVAPAAPSIAPQAPSALIAQTPAAQPEPQLLAPAIETDHAQEVAPQVDEADENEPEEFFPDDARPRRNRPGQGRKPKADRLRNITYSLYEEHVERCLELSAYERLRLRRAVDQSEIAREVMRLGLACITGNKILPEG